MDNADLTYCDGKGCGLREQCLRYVDGQRIKNGREEGQYYWMDYCDVETRNGFLNNNFKPKEL